MTTNAPRIAPEPPNPDTSGSADQPVLNVPLVEQVITQLIDHPEQHDQHWWARRNSCGTTHCVAGRAVVLAGAEFDWYPWGSGEERSAIARLADAIGRHRTEVQVAAEQLLGLTEDQAHHLFFDMGDTGHIIGRLKDLLNEASPAVSS